MRLPIQYALSYPERWPVHFETLDLLSCGPLTFFEPDREVFRALPLAIEAGRAGGIMPTVFNAANEVADDAFIKGQIPFLAMADLIEAVLSKVEPVSPLSYETIVEADRKAREVARTLLSSMGEV